MNIKLHVTALSLFAFANITGLTMRQVVDSCKNFMNSTDGKSYLNFNNKKFKPELVRCIMRQDAEELINFDIAYLQGAWELPAPASCFEKSAVSENERTMLESVICAGRTPLSLVVFLSSSNKSASQNTKTIKMLEILLNKGITINSSTNYDAAECLIVINQKNPRDNIIRDYVADFSLAEITIAVSTPAVLEFLISKGLRFDKKDGRMYVKDHHKNDHLTKEFNALVEKYGK